MPFLDDFSQNNSNIMKLDQYLKGVVDDLSLDTATKGALSNYATISQSILNILSTMPGERLFNVSFGCNLNKYLWENFNNQAGLKRDIKNALITYDPRIDVPAEGVSVYFDEPNNAIDIEITYLIKATTEWQTWSERLYL